MTNHNTPVRNVLLSIMAVSAILLVVLLASGCGDTNADKASQNITKEAEQFKVFRNILQTNGVTDKAIFSVTGFCNVEGKELGTLKSLQVTCRDFVKGQKPTYKKHYLVITDNTPVAITQLQGINVSEYRTKVIFRPESLVPDLDLVTGTPEPKASVQP